jgi:hypothetical protein
MMNVFSKGGLFIQGKLSSILAELCMQVYPNLYDSNVSVKHCTTQKCVHQIFFHRLNINQLTRMNAWVQ